MAPTIFWGPIGPGVIKIGSLRSELFEGSTLRDPDNFNGLEPDG